MDDLISRQGIVDSLTKYRIEKMLEGKNVSLVWECIDKVLQQPSIDAVPVKHGRWIIQKGACEPSYMECSNCRRITEYYGGLEEEWNFCPNCGADMRTPKLQYGDEDTLQGGLMSAT